MKKIEDIDKNFKVNSYLEKDVLKFYNSLEKPFETFGLIKPQSQNDKYWRLPFNVAKNVSEKVGILSSNTAGGRLKFKTNSSVIAIYAKMPSIGRVSQFSLLGSTGFDMYANYNSHKRYVKSFIPDYDIKDSLCGSFETTVKEMTEYTISFPLYSDVSELYIALDKEAVVEPPCGYKIKKPIIYYGSSITHGACASRPGNTYEEIISRRFDCDYINLGFAGSAKGEKKMGEYISTLDMTAFIYDYDYNAPDISHLKNTHETMFKIIREKQPDLPVICVTRPQWPCDNDTNLRSSIIKQTVDNAKKNGDSNVYFIDMGKYIGNIEYIRDNYSADGCHPNDIGFFYMANAIGEILEQIL